MRPPVVVAVALGIAVVVLAVTQGGPDYFLQLGERSRNLELARDVLGDDVAVPLEDGHDGENSWVLARDPLLLDDEAADRFDRPVYRAQRIGYPLLAAPWRFGGEQALLWGLVVTNLGAIVAGTWAAGRFGAGRPLAAYAFAFNPLVILALLFDFTDAVALAGIVLALLAAARGRAGPAAAASVAAALAKEPSLLALGAAAVLTRSLSPRLRAALVVPGAVAAGAWRLYVIGRPGFGSDPQVQELEAVPFRGFIDAWDRSWGPGGHWFDAAVAAVLVGVAIAAAVVWFRRRDLASAAALGPCLLLPFLSAQVIALPTNSLRAAGAAITLLGVSLASRPAVA